MFVSKHHVNTSRNITSVRPVPGMCNSRKLFLRCPHVLYLAPETCDAVPFLSLSFRLRVYMGLIAPTALFRILSFRTTSPLCSSHTRRRPRSPWRNKAKHKPSSISRHQTLTRRAMLGIGALAGEMSSGRLDVMMCWPAIRPKRLRR